MPKSNNKHSRSFISNAFGAAKKIGTTGINLLNHVAPGTVSKLDEKPNNEQVLQGYAQEKNNNVKKSSMNPQMMMRDHIPLVSRQLLGRHYSKFNKVTSFISPELNDKLSDYFFEKLNDFVSNLSSVEAVLKEVGARDLNELAKDPARSARISQAFENQNKRYAVVQGALTGISGVVGAAIDVPTSIALALHSIYQTGRAYGFELKAHDEQETVEYIFKRIDLGTVAEKQTLLVAVRAVARLLETHDINQLQQLLGSSNDTELLKKWLGNEDGSFKWEWLNHVPHLSIVSKLTPIAGASVGAYFSLKLLSDASHHANVVFSRAREYLNAHPDESLDVFMAFEKAEKADQSTLTILSDVNLSITETDTIEEEKEGADLKNKGENIHQSKEVQQIDDITSKDTLEQNSQDLIVSETVVDVPVIKAKTTRTRAKTTSRAKPSAQKKNSTDLKKTETDRSNDADSGDEPNLK
ncbi:EcsC family protein [Acinetobacter stercoris]|uniref:EcsC protein family protein n=1 Tax=Acinetobacter stercoris TaxID=2126983 RepID=A0A2U3N3C0_9GAMM|nr:EcsC family protein [Acinetobacter stercoris]SPL72190.1 EcsC protein family protein [Acinetobacter stercoris]